MPPPRICAAPSASFPAKLIALRFCGDEKELADLTRSVLNGEVKSRDEIKKRIKVWRPDNARA